MKDSLLAIFTISALAMQRNLCYGQQHVASMSSLPSRSRRLSGQQPEYSSSEGGAYHGSDPRDVEQLIELAEEFLGIERYRLGAYRWISLNESLLTTLERWRQRPYFCPYRPFHGKWVLTCKADLQNVKRVTGGQIRKTISIGRKELFEVDKHENYLSCPRNDYLLTCEYYWHHAMDVLKAKLLDPWIAPATKGFCSSAENTMQSEELIEN